MYRKPNELLKLAAATIIVKLAEDNPAVAELFNQPIDPAINAAFGGQAAMTPATSPESFYEGTSYMPDPMISPTQAATMTSPTQPAAATPPSRQAFDPAGFAEAVIKALENRPARSGGSTSGQQGGQQNQGSLLGGPLGWLGGLLNRAGGYLQRPETQRDLSSKAITAAIGAILPKLLFPSGGQQYQQPQQPQPRSFGATAQKMMEMMMMQKMMQKMMG